MIAKEDDDELSRCWSAWLVARGVGDDEWLGYALNELRIASLRAHNAWMAQKGLDPETGSKTIGMII